MIPGPDWARRYGSRTRRMCARPGCGAPAAATLRFEPTMREAWLVDLDSEVARSEGDLCARHATALVLPRGWRLHDDRSERPTLTVADPSAPRSVRAARARRRRQRVTTLSLPFDDAADELTAELPEPPASVEVAEVVELAEVTVTPINTSHIPRVDSDEPDELGEVLDARTPLLQRAFRNVKNG